MNKLHPALRGRSGAVTALMLLAGIVLLLPGLCVVLSAILFSLNLQDLARSPQLALLWIACFAATAGGIWLIWHALGRRPGKP